MRNILEIRDLQVHYGGIEAVRGISLDVPEGEIVTLIGANGAGKSSTLRAIAGLVKPSAGKISFLDEDITGMDSSLIVSKGITLVPEGRRIFPDMTVLENLEEQTNEKACSYLLERVDYIIDAASNASPNFFKLKPVEVMKANINGVSHLMEYGLEHGMRRMVYVSSGEIYGEGDGSEFTEMSSGYVDCASVRACYPSSKRAAETLCMSYVEEYHADVVIARLSHTYGPGFTESDNRVFAQFIRNVLRGEDIVLKSKGEAFRSWLYVVDAAHAILRLLMDGEKGNAYNVAHSESNISIRQLAELIAGKAHRKVVFDIPEDALQGNTTPITKATFNTDKLKALGWKPLFDVEQGFEHTLAECSAGSHPSSKQ